MNITDVNKSVKGHKRRRRVGRGAGSGAGKTSGRGQKGLGARAGANVLRGFLGGQTQLKERMPKRGFNNAVFTTEYVPVNLAMLEDRFDEGAEVDIIALKEKGVTIRRNDKVKILGSGDVTKKLTVKAHAFSKSAVLKIEKAGGAIEVIK